MSNNRSTAVLGEFLRELSILMDKYKLSVEGDISLLDKNNSLFLGYIEECYSSIDLVTDEGDVIVSADKRSQDDN